jgi:hypothetical protein
MLILAIMIMASAPVPDTGGHEALQALTALNNYVEAITWFDACQEQQNGRVLEQLADRIETARSHFAQRYPDIRNISGGDTEYTCVRDERRRATNRRAVRREALRLIDDLEAALTRSP